MAAVALTRIPDGDAGTFATLQAMRRLSRAGARSPAVAALALRFRIGARGDACQFIGIARRWLVRLVPFVPDPAGVVLDGRYRRVSDVLRTPQLIVQTYFNTGRAGGDCDDVATLAAALGLAVGLRARYVVYAFHTPVSPFQHVFTELECAGSWYELDTTAPAQGLEPWQLPTRYETYTV